MALSEVDTVLTAARTLFGEKGVTTDAHDMAPWLTDWRGYFHGAAAGILSPASVEDAAAIVALANRHRVALVPQGGNTNMVGGSTPDSDGRSLILSLRRMNRIRSIDTDANVAVAEAGVILSTLHDAVLEKGRRFPLTLGAKGSATIGGLCSTNAGGNQVLRFGTMRSLVLGLEAVMPDGGIWRGLKVLKKDSRGYDINQLLVSAEGTLGIITAASLKLVPAITDRAVALLALDDPMTALKALRLMERQSNEAIESFELMPREAIDVVLRYIPNTRPVFPATHPWLVLVEYVATREGVDASAALEGLLAQVIEAGLCTDAVLAVNEQQAEAFWHIRDSIAEAERARGVTLAHDISIPVDDMPGFIVDASRRVMDAFPGTTINAFGHLGDGNVHFHVQGPVDADPDHWMRDVGKPGSLLVYDLVTQAGGSISAEHGIGQLKRDELARLGDPVRLSTLRAIKSAIDPKGIMNPGKLV